MRIWSHLLKKSLIENFIFLYSDIRIMDLALSKIAHKNTNV